MIRRVLGVLLLAGLIAAGCSSDDDSADPTPTPERERPEASILPPADPDGPGGRDEEEPETVEIADDGRLAVQDENGQIYTMLPDGSERTDLGVPGSHNSQPAWAPDGSRLAWVSRDLATGDTTIRIDRFDASDPGQVNVDQAPFYLYWDPSASKIAHLSGTEAGIDLSVAEPFAEDGPTSRRIDRGEPYFLAWGPNGDELLVHASGFRLDRIDLGSATVIIDEFPATFGAPAWLTNDSLVYADIEEDDQYLITTGASGEGRHPLITFDGTLRFSVNNDGNRIAMQAVPGTDDDPVVTASAPLGPDSAAVGEPSLASFQVDEPDQPSPEPTPTPEFDDSLDPVDEIEPFIPYVMGTFGGEPHALSSNPAIAMFPSPDGQAVAWFEKGDTTSDTVVLMVEYAGAVHTSPFIELSDELLTEYLPFFDQYEASHDFWSPSSRLFVFAGNIFGEAGTNVWTWDRDTGRFDKIGPGVVATFTRTPQAAGAASAL